VRAASVLSLVGIVLNRLNIAFIAFNLGLPDRYFPSGMEVFTSITIITMGILTFRWIVNRMPVLYEHPEYRGVH